MPSPFPGMDPYLEGSEWQSVHTELSSEIARQLAPKVRPKYIVRPARRFVAELPADIGIAVESAYPDVSVLHPGRAGALTMSPAPVMEAPLQIATVISERVPHITIEIRDVTNRELVTAIEVLSPTNKRGEGYREYLDKRSRTLLSFTHLIEIDLLRKGKRVPMQKPLPPAPYFAFLSRAGRRPIVDVWPIELDMRLPVIPVPLLPDDPDVELDLQLAFNTTYDALGFDLSVDYTHPPEVPLEGEAAAWTEQCLQTAGLLPGRS